MREYAKAGFKPVTGSMIFKNAYQRQSTHNTKLNTPSFKTLIAHFNYCDFVSCIR